jgi:hypothetical protein
MHTSTAGCSEKFFEIYFLVQIQAPDGEGSAYATGGTQGCDDRHDKVKRL